MKKIFLLQIVFLLASFGQIKLPYQEDFRWGIKDALPPKYDFIDFYQYPFFLVYYDYPTQKNLFDIETNSFVFKEPVTSPLDFTLFYQRFIRVKKNHRYALLTYNGKKIRDFKYDRLFPFEDSLFLGSSEKNITVLFPSGKEIAWLQYEFAKLKASDLAFDGKNIRKNNTYIFKGVKSLKVFHNSLWCASKKSPELTEKELNFPIAVWSFFNKEGNRLFTATSFKENPYGIFVKRNKWGMINFQGKTVIPYAYDSLFDFQFGYTVALQKKGWNEKAYGILDSLGNRILNPYYRHIKILSPKFAAVQDRSKRYALFSLQGKQLTPFVFNQCEFYNNFLLCKIRKPYNLIQINYLKSFGKSEKKIFYYVLLNKPDRPVRIFAEKTFRKIGENYYGFSDGFSTEIYNENFRFIEKLPGEVKVYTPSLAIFQRKDSLFLRKLLAKDTLNVPVKKYKKIQTNELLINTLRKSYFVTGEEIFITNALVDSVVRFGKYLVGIQKNNKWFLADFSLKKLSQQADEILKAGNEYLFLKNNCYEFPEKIIGCNTDVKILNEKFLAVYRLKKYKIFDIQQRKFVETPENFLKIYPFHEGLAKVLTPKGWNFLNADLSLITPTFYDEVSDFRNGFAYFKQKGKWGVLNKNGQIVLKPEFLGIDKDDKHYKNSFRVLIEKKILKIRGKKMKNQTAYRWVFLDENSKEKFKTAYPPASYLTPAGYAVVKNGYIDNKGKVYNGKWGWEKEGKIYLKPKYDSTAYHHADYLLIKEKNRYGLYDLANSAWKLKPEYDYIGALSQGYFFAVKNKHSTLFSYDFSQKYSYESIAGIQRKYFVFKDGKFYGIHNYDREILRVPYIRLHPLSEKHLKVRSEFQFRKFRLLRRKE